jgi:hypothetical protein
LEKISLQENIYSAMARLFFAAFQFTRFDFVVANEIFYLALFHYNYKLDENI